MDIQLTKGMIMLLVGSGGIVLTLLIAIINILVSKRKQRVFDEVSLDNSSNNHKNTNKRKSKTEIIEDNETELLEKETELLEEKIIMNLNKEDS